MKQLMEAFQISIIGGADGPTTIYVCSKTSLIYEIVFGLLFGFVIYKLIKNIKAKNRQKILIFGLVALLFVIIFATLLCLNIWVLKFSKWI